MSTAENKAVFLSYASQDAEAARRICETLRSEGVEVWFDADGGLEHGDEWDAKIRKQIKDCVLFIPIISANTQAREEGYFRLEWDLAAERARTIASGVPFILPVVIDDTREPEALVPDRFRTVQWTKLPGGVLTPEVKARYLKLWSHRIGAVKADADVGRGLSTSPSGLASTEAAGSGDPALHRKADRRIPIAAWIAGAVVVLLGLVAVFWRQRLPSASLTEAQQLVAKARKILDEGDELKRENYFLAEDLVKRAVALDPAEPSAWALHADLSQMMVWHRLDFSEARRDAMRRQSERALALAPNLTDVQLAAADVRIQMLQDVPGLEASLRALAAREPANWRVQRSLGMTYRYLDRREEAVAAMQRARELSGGSAMADADLVNVLLRQHRHAEAENVMAESLAKRSSARLLTFDQMIRTQWRGDLAGAKAALAQWPDWVLTEDRGAILAWRTWFWSKDYDKAIAAVQRMRRDYLRDTFFTGPRAVLTARAHEGAGHAEAARADWRTALQLAERELAAEPTDMNASFWKAWALARLGDTAGAQAVCVQMQQRKQLDAISGITEPDKQNLFYGGPGAAPLWAVVGRPDLALAALRAPQGGNDLFAVTRAMVELDPAFDALRREPGFPEVLALLPAPQPKPSVVTAPRLGPKSIAVLPFDNLSADKDANAFFADGMHEDVVTNLLLIRELRCVPHATALAYRGTKKTHREVADELGVAYLLTGSVRRADRKVRITGTLLDPRTDEAIWTKAYDKELTDIFAIQAELAQAIATELKAALSPKEKKLIAHRPTEDPEAYDLYLKVRNERFRLNGPKQIELLEAAVARDPSFALCWAELARTLGTVYNYGVDRSPARLAQGKNAIDTAVRLAPERPEVTLSLGYYYYSFFRDHSRATAEFEKVQAAQPNSAAPRHALGTVFRRQGKFAESLASFRAAVELDPGDLDALGQVVNVALAGRRFGEARAARERIAEAAGPLRPAGSTYDARALAWFPFWETGSLRELDELSARMEAAETNLGVRLTFQRRIAAMRGDAAEVLRLDGLRKATEENDLLLVGLALAVQGRRDDARARLGELATQVRTVLEQQPENDTRWGFLGMIEAVRGESAEALRCARKAVALQPSARDTWLGPAREAELAFVLTWTGDKTGAIAIITRLLAQPNGATLNIHELKRGLGTHPLHGDPRFEALLNDPKNNAPLF